MRCKVGDIALIVPPAWKADVGKTVRCLRLATGATPFGIFRDDVGPVWEVDREVTWSSNKSGDLLLPYCADRVLMPIRPGDEERDATPEEIDHEVSV